MRPLTAGSLAVLDGWYDVELTYTSNAIEGNTLTRNETAILLEKGITVAGKPLKDYYEAVDHFDALQFVRGLAKQDRPVTEDDICRIHAIILSKSNPTEAGVYSQFQRRIKGSAVVFPSPVKIPREMAAMGGWLERQPAIPQAAFEAHYRLVSIHPFTDGNGRTARLLMNLLLLRGGYPPVVIGPEHRKPYIDGLESAQLGGSKEPYERFMMERLDASLSDYLEHLGKELEARDAGPAATPSTTPGPRSGSDLKP